MILATEELWLEPPHPGMIVVTTNSYIKDNGRLVMGRGAALQATQHVAADIALECGRAIDLSGSKYGFLEIRSPYREGKIGFGIFQVKHHWKKPASLELIEHAVQKLNEYCEAHPDLTIRMNFPGIGNGQLQYDDVLPIVEQINDQVVVCRK